MPLACLGPGRQPAAGSSLRAACRCLNVDLLVTVACSSSSQSNDNDSLKLLMSKLHAVSASSSALGSNSLSIQPSLPAHLNLPKGQSWLSSPTADWDTSLMLPESATQASASTGSASSVMYQDLTESAAVNSADSSLMSFTCLICNTGCFLYCLEDKQALLMAAQDSNSVNQEALLPVALLGQILIDPDELSKRRQLASESWFRLAVADLPQPTESGAEFDSSTADGELLETVFLIHIVRYQLSKLLIMYCLQFCLL
uniref:E3 ubiquitin-protein ligase n=1 Tax=Macrostomum lignano TaxID=282301 RepID=A0A1I8HEU1_9PLAT